MYWKVIKFIIIIHYGTHTILEKRKKLNISTYCVFILTKNIWFTFWESGSVINNFDFRIRNTARNRFENFFAHNFYLQSLENTHSCKIMDFASFCVQNFLRSSHDNMFFLLFGWIWACFWHKSRYWFKVCTRHFRNLNILLALNAKSRPLICHVYNSESIFPGFSFLVTAGEISFSPTCYCILLAWKISKYKLDHCKNYALHDTW